MNIILLILIAAGVVVLITMLKASGLLGKVWRTMRAEGADPLPDRPEPGRTRRRNWRGPTIIVLATVLILAVIFIPQAVVTVRAGTRGVLLTWGKVTGQLEEGLHFIVPIAQQVVSMDITIQKAEVSEATASKDLQEVTTQIAVNYHIDPNQVQMIYSTLRQDYVNRVINPNMDESIKATTAQFTAEELITRRADVKTKFLDILSGRLEPYGIIAESVSITDFQFNPQFQQAIESKVTQEQRALEALNKLKQIEYEAQQQVIQAEAEKNATILRAEAEKEKSILEAEGVAEGIRLVNDQLLTSPLYLQYQQILEWDGELPYFWGGGDLPFFLTVPINQTTS
jgi:regulator of protease activity HflC (stomatin/prohibitin superfamily)